MEKSHCKKEIKSGLPGEWTVVYLIEVPHGPIFAKYEHPSDASLRITPKKPYRQPWAEFEYFIEYTDNTRKHVASSRRIFYFHLAKEIAVEKMKETAED